MALPKNVHPAIRAKFSELYENMKVLTIEMQQEVDLLAKTLEAVPDDDYGVKMRVAGIEAKSAKMAWVAAKLTVLSSVSYEVNSAKGRRQRSPKPPRRG